ncbi:MAG: hypothetical protein ACFB21_09410 [Opitutales bacterium]
MSHPIFRAFGALILGGATSAALHLGMGTALVVALVGGLFVAVLFALLGGCFWRWLDEIWSAWR